MVRGAQLEGSQNLKDEQIHSNPEIATTRVKAVQTLRQQKSTCLIDFDCRGVLKAQKPKLIQFALHLFFSLP